MLKIWSTRRTSKAYSTLLYSTPLYTLHSTLGNRTPGGAVVNLSLFILLPSLIQSTLVSLESISFSPFHYLIRALITSHMGKGVYRKQILRENIHLLYIWISMIRLDISFNCDREVRHPRNLGEKQIQQLYFSGLYTPEGTLVWNIKMFTQFALY